MKFLALAALFFGELLVIYAEMLGAKVYADGHRFGSAFVLTLIPLTLGALCLVGGYMLGLRFFNNIWIVTAISFGSIVLIEPVFNFVYMQQIPGLGAGIGAVFGVLGILARLFL